MRTTLQRITHSCALLLVVCVSLSLNAADSLTWNTNENRVTAEIQAVPLVRFLEGVAQLTGWHVYLESNATHTVSAKFQNLTPGDALPLLLGRLNFALVPAGPGTRARLYVFQSSRKNATQAIQPKELDEDGRSLLKIIANELLLTLKPGVKLDQLPCLENAKVTGRMDALNAYRLTFDDEASAKAARECLADNEDVESIDSNHVIEKPDQVFQLEANIAPDFDLKLKEPSGDCRPIIALIDTGFGSLGEELDKFILPTISVAGQAAASGEMTHGGAMAETMLRSLQSITEGSTSALIQPVDVFGTNQLASTWDIGNGIYQAMNSDRPPNIYNLSLGSAGESELLQRLIRAGTQQGIVFFGAAGNQPVSTPYYPAAYPEVIAVTAGDRNGELAPYANRGSFVDIIAPGTSVVPFNGQSYVINGTSTATAYASGLAAGLADSNQACPQDVVPAIRTKLGVKRNSTP